MLPPFFAVDFEGLLTGGLVWKWGGSSCMLAKSALIGQFAKASAHRRNPTKKAPETRSLLLPPICAKPVSREPQDLPCAAGGLPVNPLNGSRVCLASRLWSSQIFCDSE